MMGQTVEIYLDDNATTRVMPAAAQEAFAVMEDLYGNPSSSHIAGLQARRILESARTVARQVLGADQGRIVFTSGATEAIQTGIFSALCEAKKNPPIECSSGSNGLLLYGATEHKAVPQALTHWNELLDIRADVLAIPVDGNGQIDQVFLREHIDRAHILCTMAVNNETGVIHDLQAIEKLVLSADHKVAWLVDCVQAVGKLELNLSGTAIDYAPISGHKIYAPKGIGILYVREGAPFTPLIAGGGQEGGARGGTENLPGVAAIATSLNAMVDRDAGVFSDPETLQGFRDQIALSLKTAFPSIVFNTPFDQSVPTTINFAVPGFMGKEILDLFDAAGIRVSSGSACGSAIRGSYVLEAMGLPKWRSDGAIRLSFGPATAAGDVDLACAKIEETGAALADSSLLVSPGSSIRLEHPLDGLLQLKMGSMCSWILTDASTKRCVIVDPFAELSERIKTIVQCQQLKVIAVLDTHQHVDHKSPRESLVDLLSNHMTPPHSTVDVLGWPMESDGQISLGDGTLAPFVSLSASLIIAMTPLPGHTVDGQAFLVGEPTAGRLEPKSVRFAFTGDTMQIGGIGRTDFATSDSASLMDSLRRLPEIMADRTIVCPTHDYSIGFVTTLGSERSQNKLLAQILDPGNQLSLDGYLAAKQEFDSQIDDENNCELVCGHIRSYSDAGTSSIDVEPEQLKEFFERHADSLIVDVREPHEFRFTQDWDSLGFKTPPENVPLTRLADFLSRLLIEDSFLEEEIIFICRSGNRSAKAAQVVRRLGISHAWHVAGGLALGTLPSREVVSADEIEYAI